MASDLSQFGLTEMLRCSRALHRAAAGAPTMEATARRISRLLYDELQTPNGDRACALVRCYKTHPFGALPADLQRFAGNASGEDAMGESTRCLTLLASAGSEPHWNARSSSKGHQAIPLASPQMVEQAPMIAALIRDFGLELADVTNPKPENMRNSEGKSFGIFHVEHAVGSAAIPAQEEFVGRYAVQSVVGFGGSLASGDLFAVILFSRVRVSAESAERFRTLALDVKALYFPFTESSVFDREDSAPRSTTEIGLPA
jgi:hypothetical protein